MFGLFRLSRKVMVDKNPSGMTVPTQPERVNEGKTGTRNTIQASKGESFSKKKGNWNPLSCDKDKMFLLSAFGCLSLDLQSSGIHLIRECHLQEVLSY